MTLIAYTNNYNRPILIGDILLTSKEEGKQVEIPTFLQNIEGLLPTSQTIFPYSLRQKLYVINEKIAIGMAGNVYQMTRFLEDFKCFFKYYPTNKEGYAKFLETYDISDISECAIVICIIEKVDDSFQFTHNYIGDWNRVNHPVIEFSNVVGTGASSFIDTIKTFNGVDITGTHPVSINLSLLSNMIAMERLTLASIMEAWGAGFEIIECTDGNFKKVDELTFVIWKSKINEESTDLDKDPFLIFHYKYSNDVLIINTFSGGKIARYAVLPLDMKREDFNEDEVPASVDFSSKLLVSTFIIEYQNEFYFPTLVSELGDGTEAIKVNVKNNGSTIEVMIREDISRKLAQETIKIARQ